MVQELRIEFVKLRSCQQRASRLTEDPQLKKN
jgi:hypothetical protein